MRPSTRRRISLFVEALGVGAVIGALIGSARGLAFHPAPLPGAILGGVAGLLNGVLLIGTVGAAEIFLSRTRIGRLLERTPFVVTFVMKVLVYSTLTVCIIGGRVGRRLAVAVAAPILGSDPAVVSHVLDASTEQQLAISLVILGVGVLVLELGYLVGVQTLRDIALAGCGKTRL